VEDGQNLQGLFLGSIDNDKIANGVEAQRPGSEFGSRMAHFGEGDERANCFKNLVENAIGRGETIGGDEVPDFLPGLLLRWGEGQIRS